jgi:xanthine dehydrogenase accessory factor
VIDAMMAKRPGATRIDDAPLVIALGPGHAAGVHAHAVIETKRGHQLGRVITSGCAASDTGKPGEVAGLATERVLRAPLRGTFEPAKRIGELVAAGETVGRVDGHPVIAGASGILRGLLSRGVIAEEGMKIGDVDPRGDPRAVHEISDKARAIAGGVLEAMLRFRDKWE